MFTCSVRSVSSHSHDASNAGCIDDGAIVGHDLQFSSQAVHQAFQVDVHDKVPFIAVGIFDLDQAC